MPPEVLRADPRARMEADAVDPALAAVGDMVDVAVGDLVGGHHLGEQLIELLQVRVVVPTYDVEVDAGLDLGE
jgi:hypothetical protein